MLRQLVTGWHRKLHRFGFLLYYIEYGLARLGVEQTLTALDPA
jgi:hypothetical protein